MNGAASSARLPLRRDLRPRRGVELLREVLALLIRNLRGGRCDESLVSASAIALANSRTSSAPDFIVVELIHDVLQPAVPAAARE